MIARVRARLTSLPSFADFNRLVVGVISMVVIAGACAAALAVGTFGLLQRTYEMSGVFSEAAGIKGGADVRSAGVRIGKVTGVHPDFDRGQLIVTWKVNQGVHLGRDTTAEVAISNLLGGFFVRLSGPVTRPYLDELPKAQRRIPRARTRTPYTIIDTLGKATRAVEQLDVSTVNRVVAQLAEAASKNEGNVGSLLANLQTVAGAINERDADLRQLVRNSQQATTTLAAKDQQLASLVDAAKTLLDELDRRHDQLATLLGSGSKAVKELADLVTLERAQLDAVLGDLHVVIEAAGRELPAVNRSLAWVGPTFSGLAKAGSHGPWAEAVLQGLGPLDVTAVSRVSRGAP